MTSPDTSVMPMTTETAEYVDDILAVLVRDGQAALERLGFKGVVVVNIEWTDNPRHGYLCIGSQIPNGATPLLADSLRESASTIADEEPEDERYV